QTLDYYPDCTSFPLDQPYTVLFLDIELPGMDGIQFAKQLHQQKYPAIIVFITNKKDLIYDAFGMNVFRFIPKDQLESRLPALFEDLAKEYHKNTEFLLETTKGTVTCTYNDVIYVEKIGQSLFVQTTKDLYELRYVSIQDLYDTFDRSSFLFVNRSVFVNIAYVKRIHKLILELSSCKKLIEISRRRLLDVQDSFHQFMKS
ncbi:MAG: response regulator transcription factor, partial [Erysipelotrichaceae bacterium]|nr:response regulator transcription factor [Erysipelotrichaceae bacterium]